MTLGQIRVDGGLTRNPFLMQFQADLLKKPLAVFKNVEATGFGTAFFSGLSVKQWNTSDISALDSKTDYKIYEPDLSDHIPGDLYGEWKKNLQRSIGDA